MLESVYYDVKFALRLLRRNPRNTVLAVAILGLGIGANTAMFSAINHVLLRPLPFTDSDRLVRLRDAVVGSDGALHPFNMRARSVVAVQRGAPVFDRVVALSGENMTLAGDSPERVSVVFQSEGVADALGVHPAIGRGFTREEEQRGLASGVAIISDALWQSRFGGSTGALGQSMRLDERTFTIVGIMPPQYAFPYEAQVWVPFVLNPADLGRDFAVLAHLAPRVNDTQVRDALGTVAADLRRTYPDVLAGYRIQIMPLRESLVDTQAGPLRALNDVVAFLLLIAAVNVATLLLARSVARRREFAVRAMLGASRARHISQLIVESLVLAACGCAVGLLLVAWLGPLTSSLIPSVLSGQLGLTTPRTDWRVLAFAIAVSLASAIVAGIVPAFGSWRQEPKRALTDGGRAATTGTRGQQLLGALIVAETALTLVLLVGGGLVIRNFVRLASLPLGFDAQGLVTFELTPPPASYPSGSARAALIRRLLDEVKSVAGVANAAVTTVNPLGGGTWGASVISENVAARDPNAVLNINDRIITPSLIETMGIRMLRGRSFGDQDRANTLPVAIVSEQLSKRFWPGADPIGKRLRIARPNAPWLTIIGVAGDVSDSHDPGVPLETWYRPFDQNADSSATEHVYVMIRTGADSSSTIAAAKLAVGRVDKTLAPYLPTDMDAYWNRSIARERISALFMLGFGAFGLALAALGVYGVMAFTVAQRTTEFGIRLALGATRSDILPLVLRRSAAQIAIGLGAGTTAAIWLNHVLASLLTEGGPLDPAVVAGAALLNVTAALAACLVPALQATRLDPVKAMKAE